MNMNMNNQAKSRTPHRVLEQQRRKHMNMLYSSLRSSLPAEKQEVKLTLPDLIQEASIYIEELQKQIAEFSHKRDSLQASKELVFKSTERKNMVGSVRHDEAAEIIPTILVNCFGSIVTVQIAGTLGNRILFSDTIAFLQGEGLEILTASTFCRSHRVFFSFHLKVSNEKAMNGGILHEKLRFLIAGNSWRAPPTYNHGGECSNSIGEQSQEWREWEQPFQADNNNNNNKNEEFI